MNHLPVFILCLLAFAALAAATDRAQETLFGRALGARAGRLLRKAGWMLLLLALAVAVRSQGWGLGLVSYSGHTSLAAGLVFVFLVFLARRRGAG